MPAISKQPLASRRCTRQPTLPLASVTTTLISFASVTAGNYIVEQTDPSGYLSTTSNTVPLVVAPNGAGSADLGDQQQGIISGVVFNDNNGKTPTRTDWAVLYSL